MKTTYALPQLAAQFAVLSGFDAESSEKFIKTFFNQIENALSVSENVVIKGLGTFIRTDNPENPISFIPDKNLAAALNQPFEMFSPIEVDASIAVDSIEQPQPEPVIETDILEEIEALNDEPVFEVHHEAEPEIQAAAEKETTSKADENPPEPVEPAETTVQENHYYQTPEPTLSWTKAILFLIAGLIIGFIAGYLLHKFTNLTIEAETATIIVEEEPIVEQADTIVEPVEAIEEIAEPAPEVKPEPVYDTVSADRFLTTMARKYYGQMEYWVFIYKANEDILGHPNRIKPGTRVRIPDKSEFIADETPEQTLARAKAMGEEIYSRF